MAECTGCGGFVTDDYARVFGDNEGNISECRSCRARSSPSEDAEDAGEAGERVVLLRDVAGDDSTGGNESENGEAASDTGTTPGSSEPSVSSSSVAAPDAPEQGAEETESAGASERIAGFFSSLRG